MLNNFFKIVKKRYNRFKQRRIESNLLKIKNDYIKRGKEPWTPGYNEFKTEEILNSISEKDVLKSFKDKIVPNNFGYRIDERIVEYTWIFSKLQNNKATFLDAGSTFNFDYLLGTGLISKKQKYIYTFYPEKLSFNEKQVSYVYGDLRDLPFKDDFFEEIVCQSTIEHIDMDNSIYGYNIEHNKNETKKSYEYLLVIEELIRVLKSKGKLLITFPFGKFENHGFFQQFDDEMLVRLTTLFNNRGDFEIDYFKYEKEGWRFANRNELRNVASYNPHTGKGKLEDGAAHCRSVACVSFNKK
ncbi:methyltransferase domain-containing protein [Winogradskyella sp. PG-2]|uniref:methyltransferase domain-containing protein n=1 Tax=Winogradskyella sp. PG-2 TaxID=754409 RepID=UPI0004586CC8|nr:methyltransferase domain-containing protein [Winogradskyella sp. PG-2]BAO74410.1 hypothetical protein WPG_0180 [Winogradskyella sp. PG-2]